MRVGMVESLIPTLRGVEGACDLVTGSVALVSGAFETASAILKFVQIPAVWSYVSALWAQVVAQLAAAASNPFTLVMVGASIAAISGIIYACWEYRGEIEALTRSFQELGEVTVTGSVLPDMLEGIRALRREAREPIIIDLQFRGGGSPAEIDKAIERYVRKETGRAGVLER